MITMIAEEFINDRGYINTTIKTETPEETKILLRAIYLNQGVFSEIRKNGEIAENCVLDCPVKVTTVYYKDIRIKDILPMLNDAKEDYQSLRTIEVKGVKIREDIVIRIGGVNKQFSRGAGRIGIITTMNTKRERRLRKLLLDDNGYTIDYYDFRGSREDQYYYLKVQHEKLEDLRLAEIIDIITQAERDVDSLQKLTESWQLEKIATKTKETEMKITRKVRVA